MTSVEFTAKDMEAIKGLSTQPILAANHLIVGCRSTWVDTALITFLFTYSVIGVAGLAWILRMHSRLNALG